MAGILSGIWDAIVGIFESVVNLVITIIEGILSFAKAVLGFFRGLKHQLKQGRDVPFLADANSKQFKEMLHKAPKKNVGLFEGVYNEDTDEITDYQYVEADAVDQKTREVMSGKPLVVLS